METIKLDLIPGKKMPSLHASQYDDGRDYHIDLAENRVPYTLDGTETISLTVRKCDNTLVTMDIANTFADKSYIEFRTTEQMNACAGFNYGEITIEKNGTQISSLNFYLQVEGAPDEGGITSQSEINNLARQVHDIVVEELEDNGAEDTGYDNTESGLEATNVQDAIDELARSTPEDVYTKEETDETFATKTALEEVASDIPTKTSQLQNDSGFAQIDDTSTANNKAWSAEKVNTELSGKASENDLQALEDSVQDDYAQKLTQTLKVGENILTDASVVLGANWSGTLASGFSHSSGSTESLEFNVPTTSGNQYLISFNATNVGGTVLYVKIGNTPDVDIYNGFSNFFVGVVSDGGNLVLTPKSTYNGTITNLELREVKDNGNEVTFEVKNVNTKENDSGLSGFWNVALGFNSFDNNENGSRNVALGYCSLQDFKSGTRNLALGTFAMNRLVSGDRNVAIGADSLWYATHAVGCIAIGHNSMHGVGTDIEHNIAIGQDTMGGVTTGKNNVAIGSSAMAFAQSSNATGCVSIGYESGYYSKTGNTNVGFRAGYYNRGIRNTTLGYQAGSQNYISGDDNVFLGFNSGIDNTGGTASNPKSASKSIAIGQNAKVNKSAQMMLGSTDITEVVFCGNKKINFNNDGTVTWETLT